VISTQKKIIKRWFDWPNARNHLFFVTTVPIPERSVTNAIEKDNFISEG